MTTDISPPFAAAHSVGDPLTTSIPSYPHLPLQSSVVSSYLLDAVSVSRLNELYRYLWTAGRPHHIRPLHTQLLLQRRLLITENPGMHLVWRGDRIYLKPLPVALLSYEFWQRFICPRFNKDGTPSSDGVVGPYYAAAHGFLASYTELLQHPSDFNIAHSHGFLPSELSWETWCLLAADVRAVLSSPTLSFTQEPRWEYGELRLGRLNLIYKFTLRGFSYFYVHTEYGAFLGENFRLLLLIFAYAGVVLASMQIVMAYSDAPGWVVQFSYRFAVIAATFVFVAASGGIGLLIYLFIWHWRATMRELKKVGGKKSKGAA
ncbi:hypothetical protein MMC10_003575 [Thelotrema lepadinum]|nr:hypothetical protein [Thelotrema lepadinum]